NTYSYGEEKLGVGRENAKRFLKENGKIMEKISKDIWKKVKEEEQAA
ncbi:MAG: DNA recombination/repair protein RecA, partial [Candidatus Jacksonbacteria bacterium]|nr:DNA recombination/repair protein RecA [Candidatus Jacksonbacteria bacterium]MBT7339227.1 DNA recombination/repair protein RecA [Candidatus Jacksonbacteria bacterium]